MRLLPPKATLVILTLVALMKAPDAMPAFKKLQVLDFKQHPSVLDFTQRKAFSGPHRRRAVAAPSRQGPRQLQDISPQRSIPLPGPFLCGLAALGNPPARRDHPHCPLWRFSHNRRSDHRRHTQAHAEPLRRRGHGFCLLAKPWAWYGHNGVEDFLLRLEHRSATTAKLKDGSYGLGGVSFRGEVGAHTDLVLKDPNHTQLEVSYMRQPGGGAFQVSAQGKPLGSVETRGPAVEPG